jgi:hypothetical protein
MSKALRITLGVAIVGLVLCAAELATRDCRIALYVYDNCMLMGLHSHLGMPDSRFLRMGVMECVGIVLALILYLTFRFVFPRRRGARAAPDSPAPLAPEPPRRQAD